MSYSSMVESNQCSSQAGVSLATTFDANVREKSQLNSPNGLRIVNDSRQLTSRESCHSAELQSLRAELGAWTSITGNANRELELLRSTSAQAYPENEGDKRAHALWLLERRGLRRELATLREQTSAAASALNTVQTTGQSELAQVRQKIEELTSRYVALKNDAQAATAESTKRNMVGKQLLKTTSSAIEQRARNAAKHLGRSSSSTQGLGSLRQEETALQESLAKLPRCIGALTGVSEVDGQEFLRQIEMQNSDLRTKLASHSQAVNQLHDRLGALGDLCGQRQNAGVLHAIQSRSAQPALGSSFSSRLRQPSLQVDQPVVYVPRSQTLQGVAPQAVAPRVHSPTRDFRTLPNSARPVAWSR